MSLCNNMLLLIVTFSSFVPPVTNLYACVLPLFTFGRGPYCKTWLCEGKDMAVVGISCVLNVSVVSGVNEVTGKIVGGCIGSVDKAGKDEVPDDFVKSSLLCSATIVEIREEVRGERGICSYNDIGSRDSLPLNCV